MNDTSRRESPVLTLEGYSALLEAAVDAIVVIDADGIILNFNPAAEALFGFAATEVCGAKVNTLMPEPYRGEHDGYMKNYITTGEAKIIGIGRKVEGQKKDGTLFPLELSVGEYRHDGERYFVGIIRDMTDREQVEFALQEARERLAHVDRVSTMGEMASGIAHEINQPLTAISSYLQAGLRRLESGRADEAKLKELLAKSAEQAQRAGTIVKRIRGLIRSRQREVERVNVNEIVTATLPLARADANSRGVAIDVQLMPHPREVIADGVQLQQVILNLVVNAIDATDEAGIQHGRIEIRTQPAELDNFIEIRVRDFGPGIPEDVRDRLFEPFITTKEKGTGMGLSISRSIVGAHGGKLWCEDGPDGTCFRFILPYTVDDSHDTD